MTRRPNRRSGGRPAIGALPPKGARCDPVPAIGDTFPQTRPRVLGHSAGQDRRTTPALVDGRAVARSQRPKRLRHPAFLGGIACARYTMPGCDSASCSLTKAATIDGSSVASVAEPGEGVLGLVWAICRVPGRSSNHPTADTVPYQRCILWAQPELCDQQRIQSPTPFHRRARGAARRHRRRRRSGPVEAAPSGRRSSPRGDHPSGE